MMMYRLAQCIWGFPQTLAGAVLFLANRKQPHFSYHGAIVTTWKSKSSVSLGLFVFVTEDPFFYYPESRSQFDEPTFSRMLLVHEYGHTIQSLLLGPIYLFAVGLPSVLWSFVPYYVRKREHKQMSYFSGYPERWANHLGEWVTKEASIGEPL